MPLPRMDDNDTLIAPTLLQTLRVWRVFFFRGRSWELIRVPEQGVL